MTTETQIQTKPSLAMASMKSLIQSDAFRGQIEKAIPKHLSPERFLRIAITALTRTPKLAECTQASLCKCLLDLSAVGLEPDGRRAHLIPYGKECTLIIDYKGLVELIRRSGDVVTVRAETVCENDFFEWENGAITHKVDWKKPRGEVRAAYAEARMKSGEVQTATMTYEEIESIRNRSKAGKSGPWVTDWSEMAKKTPLRRLTKMLPLSAEVAEHIDNVDRPIDFHNIKQASAVVRDKPIDPFAAEEVMPKKRTEHQPKEAPRDLDLEGSVE